MIDINPFKGLSLPYTYGVLRKAYSLVWREYKVSRRKFDYLCILRALDDLGLSLSQSNVRILYSDGNTKLRYYREWSIEDGYVIDGGLTVKAFQLFEDYGAEVTRLLSMLEDL